MLEKDFDIMTAFYVNKFTPMTAAQSRLTYHKSANAFPQILYVPQINH